MNTAEIKDLASRYLMNNYGERSLALVRGEGTRVWDSDGKEYLDFVAGISVCSLGHCHPREVEAIREQAGRLMHVSNLYLIEPQVRLAEFLCRNSFGEKAFFCNSGAEANETAIKIARKYAKDKGHPQRFEILSLEESFHGRTLVALAVTGQAKHHRGFEPLPNGSRYAPINDIRGLENSVTDRTAAILIEPVQGEGGIRVCSEEFLRAARRISDERDILLIFDEVQTGLGRTGTLFAYQRYGVEPDVMTLAKALGGGFPIGAALAGPKAANTLTPGTHATTFGGNPLAAAAALATVTTLIDEGLPERADRLGNYFMGKLREIAQEKTCIREVRGLGLLIGVEMDREVAPFVAGLAKEGFLALSAGPNVLRFVPPLVVSEAEIDSVLEALSRVLPA